MKIKKLSAVLTALMLLSSVTACSGEDVSETTAEENKIINVADVSLSDDSIISINRSVRSETVSMGKAGTWTVFVYLCGADLESENYMASMDMEEMMEASTGENVRYIVQTGGADGWYYDDMNPDLCQRWLIQDGEIEEVYSSDAVNMGESQSLADFLKWGVAEYPAADMGLILWNHGSGSVNGVCFDETADDDALLLKELDAALYSVYDNMTEPFTFIGFDACLMATAEAAAMLATHAEYMIASQESEPGYGWNYTALGNYLDEHPNCKGSEIGKAICDSFYADCKEVKKENSATLSVIDLSKMDNFISAFDNYAEELYQMTEDSADFSGIARNISSADNFGGNNRMSGYTNMVDLAGVIHAGESQCDSAKTALQALSDAVVYQVKGSDHADACGLSVYYPLQVQDGSTELRNCAKINQSYKGEMV